MRFFISHRLPGGFHAGIAFGRYSGAAQHVQPSAAATAFVLGFVGFFVAFILWAIVKASS